MNEPAGIPSHLLEWLRRSCKKGCWNCGQPGHQNKECPKEKVFNQQFCGKCGDVMIIGEDCRNCYLTYLLTGHY